jgi:hypothetical protein
VWGCKTAEDRSHLDPGLTESALPNSLRPQHALNPQRPNVVTCSSQQKKNHELASTSSNQEGPLLADGSHTRLLFFTCDEHCPSACQISLAVGNLKWLLRIRKYLDRSCWLYLACLTAHAADLNSAPSTSGHLAQPTHHSDGALPAWFFSWYWCKHHSTSSAEKVGGPLGGD